MNLIINEMKTREKVKTPNGNVVLKSIKSPPKKALKRPKLFSGFSMRLTTRIKKMIKLKFVYIERKLV